MGLETENLIKNAKSEYQELSKILNDLGKFNLTILELLEIKTITRLMKIDDVKIGKKGKPLLVGTFQLHPDNDNLIEPIWKLLPEYEHKFGKLDAFYMITNIKIKKIDNYSSSTGDKRVTIELNDYANAVYINQRFHEWECIIHNNNHSHFGEIESIELELELTPYFSPALREFFDKKLKSFSLLS